jgi:hypothetical protein
MSDTMMKIVLETVQISLLVLVMMIAVDLINVWTRGKIGEFLKKGKQWRQYVVASLVGTMPGCVGAFTNVSLYVHGMISFGALVGAMAAVSGDEAFVMLAMFPKAALLLFGILLILGVFIGWLTDRLVRRWHVRTCNDCTSELFHDGSEGFSHYIKEHVWIHIIKRHLLRTVLWTSGALLLVEFGLQHWNLQQFTSEHALTMLFVGALIGLIPESGPHLIIVTMFAGGLVPFSVLLTSSIVQDGHGMLPMLAYSVKDSVKIKGFNLGFGLIIGLVVYLIGW